MGKACFQGRGESYTIGSALKVPRVMRCLAVPTSSGQVGVRAIAVRTAFLGEKRGVVHAVSLLTSSLGFPRGLPFDLLDLLLGSSQSIAGAPKLLLVVRSGDRCLSKHPPASPQGFGLLYLGEQSRAGRFDQTEKHAPYFRGLLGGSQGPAAQEVRGLSSPTSPSFSQHE